MKKNVWIGICALVLSAPALAQSVEDLQRELAQKEGENRQLRERIALLEREVTPVRLGHTRGARLSVEPGEDGDEEESNRALERALVRDGAMVLSPGSFELEPNFAFSYRNDNYSQTRRHSFGPALALRAGLPWRSQIEASVPYVLERRRDGALGNDADGIGDATIGLSHQLMTEGPSAPALLGAVRYQAATGENTVFDGGSPVALGAGFASVEGSLTALKRIDPLVIFGSYSLTHTFPKQKQGRKVDLGNSQTVRVGTALATGPDTSLRAALSMTFFQKIKLGENLLAGTDNVSAMLELGAALALTESMALDVLSGIGLTSNAPDFRITVALPFRF